MSEKIPLGCIGNEKNELKLLIPIIKENIKNKDESEDEDENEDEDEPPKKEMVLTKNIKK